MVVGEGSESITQRMVRQVVDAHNAALERACERALQGGKHGVLVVDHGDGSWTIGVSELVPYGKMVQVPEVGLSRWMENGCPS